MNKKLLNLQKMELSSSNDTPFEKSNLSIICQKGDGSSVSLYACTSLGNN